MIRIGLLGAGAMAGVYADRIGEIERASVTAVSSPNTASSFVDEHELDATPYTDAEDLCASGEVDAVAVIAPTHLHADLVETAAAYGLDVICEKPIARTLEGAHRIERAVESAGITCMVAHVTRFFPAYATAKDRLDDGKIGTPGVVRTRRAFGFEGSRGWFEDTDKSGGVLLDLAIHDFDYLRWAVGDIEQVFTRRVEWDGEGTSEVNLSLIRFDSGAVGHVESWAVEGTSFPFTNAFEFAGDEGHIEFDIDEVQSVVHYDEAGRHTPRDPIPDDFPLREDGFYRQLDHFCTCVETGEEPAIPAEEGIESLRVGLAALESAERGEPIAVTEVGE